MSDRVRPEPAKYKTTNWRRYNQALKARGALMVWLDRDLQWSGLASGKRGRNHCLCCIFLRGQQHLHQIDRRAHIGRTLAQCFTIGGLCPCVITRKSQGLA